MYAPRLFAILVVGVALVLSLILVQQSQDTRKKASAQTSVFITPQTQTLLQGQTFTTQVLLTTATNQITGVDLVLTFDSRAITITSVTQGSGISAFTSVIRNQIDQKNGKILYSAFTIDKTKAVYGSDVIALVITGQVAPKARATTYKIGFDPATTASALSEQQNVFASMVGGSLTVTKKPRK
jgi:hypothetical protein